MLLHELVATTETVAATSSRLAKIDALAALLRGSTPTRSPPRSDFLTAKPRQGRIGVGWRGVAALAGRARDGADAHRARTWMRRSSGWPRHPAPARSARGAPSSTGSAARATAGEWDFLTRVILGELRTGALEGVLLDAVARASEHARRGGAARGDALGRPRRDGAHRAHRRRRRARPDRPGRRAPGAADARLDGRIGRRGHRRPSPGAASVEYKLDGARIQVHRRGQDVQVYTRNLADITHRVPEIVEVGALAGRSGSDPRRRDALARRRRRAATVPGHDGPLRLGDRECDRAAAVVLRRPAPRRTRPDRRAARGAPRGARAHRGAVAHPGPRHGRCRGRRAAVARGARRRSRGCRRQGSGLGVCGGATGQELDQGQAGADVRPRRAGRRVGLGSADRTAVEPAPGRPGSHR